MDDKEIKLIYDVILKGWKSTKKYLDEYDGSDKPDKWWNGFRTEINEVMELTDGSIFQIFASEYCSALIGILQEADKRRIRQNVKKNCY